MRSLRDLRFVALRFRTVLLTVLSSGLPLPAMSADTLQPQAHVSALALVMVLSAGVPLSALSADAPQQQAHVSASATSPLQRPVPAAVRAAPDAASQGLTSAQSTYVDGMGQSIKTGDLAKFSGGTNISTTTNTMTLNGTVNNNVDVDVQTGLNSISGGSLAGSAGIPMVIQNSGDNVLIQNATIVNVQFKQ